jgi:hypothetical protein
MQDDVIPLSEPVRIVDGDFTDRACIQKGTVIVVPSTALNCSIRCGALTQICSSLLNGSLRTKVHRRPKLKPCTAIVT